eukprot:gene5263-18499_t
MLPRTGPVLAVLFAAELAMMPRTCCPCVLSWSLCTPRLELPRTWRPPVSGWFALVSSAWMLPRELADPVESAEYLKFRLKLAELSVNNRMHKQAEETAYEVLATNGILPGKHCLGLYKAQAYHVLAQVSLNRSNASRAMGELNEAMRMRLMSLSPLHPLILKLQRLKGCSVVPEPGFTKSDSSLCRKSLPPLHPRILKLQRLDVRHQGPSVVNEHALTKSECSLSLQSLPPLHPRILKLQRLKVDILEAEENIEAAADEVDILEAEENIEAAADEAVKLSCNYAQLWGVLNTEYLESVSKQVLLLHSLGKHQETRRLEMDIVETGRKLVKASCPLDHIQSMNQVVVALSTPSSEGMLEKALPVLAKICLLFHVREYGQSLNMAKV